MVLCISFFLYGTNTWGQANPNIAIVLNEYCAANITGPADNFGQMSDWVELYNAHTSSVSLSDYYLSNDRNNLKKWKFPAGFNMGVGGYGLVWLSGRSNPTANDNFMLILHSIKAKING